MIRWWAIKRWVRNFAWRLRNPVRWLRIVEARRRDVLAYERMSCTEALLSEQRQRAYCSEMIRMNWTARLALAAYEEQAIVSYFEDAGAPFEEV